MNPAPLNRKRFFLNIVLPTALAIGLFVILIFGIIIPYFEYYMLNGKKEMIRELVNSAVSLAERYEQDVMDGIITREEAQNRAIRRISHLRYGVGNKDYFWITDTRPSMIVHPYRSDLDGKNLTKFTDPTGKALFVVSVGVVEENGEGFVDYQWQWMDDSTMIVPKISFVKLFKPWGWIIGTGIYIEDVRNEIAGIKQKLIITLLGICFIIALLLIYIARQNLRAEIKRLEAEQLLKESREKYRSLIEASTEGAFMILDGQCVYSNQVIRTMMNLSQGDTLRDDLRELIDPDRTSDIERITQWLSGESMFMNIETQLITPNDRVLEAVLYLSKITLSSQRGLIVIVKDVSAEPTFRSSPVRETWLNLSESFGIGFFRSQPGRRGKFIDANDTAVRILGFKNKDELLRHTILDLVIDLADRKNFIRTLDKDNIVINNPLRICSFEDVIRIISVTAIVYRDQERQIEYVDGIIRDISEQSAADEQRDELIVTLRQAYDLWNQPVRSLMKEASRCSYLLSISQAAALLASKQSGALIVTSDSGECIGLLTDELFRDVLSRRFWNPEQPVFEIMHSPVISIHPDTSLADAISLMDEKQSGYLVIKEQNGQIAGMIHYHDLAGILFQAYQMNRNIIPHLATGTQIKNLHDRTRRLIGLMINNHSRIDDITAAYSHFADRVTQEFASQIISELGSPPVPFAIIALGSEGRSEQTLMTDQDNALIYGSGILNDSDFIKNYFLQFGSRLNRLLDETGYHLCKGDVMARNPKWCQPLPVWQTYFNTWIQTPEPQAVLDISTFFDLRCVYGDHQLVLDLKQSIDNNLTHHPAFFSHMAIACMNYKIPIGLFKKIQTETDSEYANSINIKSPIRVIVHIIRLYAMFHRIGETNTLLRMKRLYDKNIFTPSIFNEWKDTYEFLMMLQLRHQSIAAEQRRPLTPYIHLSDITSVETDTLVSVFNRISLFQTALSRDFSIPK